MKRSTTQPIRPSSSNRSRLFVLATGFSVALAGCVQDLPPVDNTQATRYKLPDSILGFVPNPSKNSEGEFFRLKGSRLRTWVLRFPTGLQYSRSEERETTERRLIKLLLDNPIEEDLSLAKVQKAMKGEFQKLDLIFAAESPMVHPDIVDHQIYDAAGKPVVRLYSSLDGSGRFKVSWNTLVANITQYMARTWCHEAKRIRLSAQYFTDEKSTKIQIAEVMLQVADDRPLSVPIKTLDPGWRAIRTLVRSDVSYIFNGSHTAENLWGYVQELEACYPIVAGPFSPVVPYTIQLAKGQPVAEGMKFPFPGDPVLVKSAVLPNFASRRAIELPRGKRKSNLPEFEGYSESIIVAPTPLTSSQQDSKAFLAYGAAIDRPNFVATMKERGKTWLQRWQQGPIMIRRGRGGGR